MDTPFDQALARFISECVYVVAIHDLVTKWRIELSVGPSTLTGVPEHDLHEVRWAVEAQLSLRSSTG